MTHFTLPPSFVLLVALAALAQPAPIDLKGKSLAATFNDLLPGMSAADNGARSAAQQRWQDICLALSAPGNETLRSEACTIMVAKLDARTPKLARLWLLQQLQRIGREESVEALATVLSDADDEVRDMAVRALSNNPSPKATEKLVAALAAANEAGKIGLLNGLGQRGDAAATAAVAGQLPGDAKVGVAAARALGRIPGDDALQALQKARPSASGAVRAAIADALLVHADRRLKAGRHGEAAKLYAELNVPEEPRSVRLAALRGLIQTRGDAAGELVLSILTGDDAKAKAVAIGQIERLSPAALKTLAASMDKLTVPIRVSVVVAVAAGGDRSQLPFVLEAAKSSEAEVKQAGIRALGRLGDASTVEFLLEVAASKDTAAGAAVESLAALPAESVNEKLIAALNAEKTASRRAALIGILDRRKAVSAVPALVTAASDADASVRNAAFAGLKSLAAPTDAPGMIVALLKTAKGNERSQAEIAIATVLSQVTNREARAEPVLAAINTRKDREADLLPLLGRLGGKDALETIRRALGSTDPALHEAAAAGLCNWPDDAANSELLALAASTKSEAEKLRAIQALIRVNAVLTERTAEEKLQALDALKSAMKLATRDQERRAILEGVGNVRHIESLRFVVPYLDDAAYQQAACKGVVELAHSKMLREPNKAEFEKALNRVIELCKDRGLVDRAKQYLEGR
jgi:HEAT repeat protein